MIKLVIEEIEDDAGGCKIRYTKYVDGEVEQTLYTHTPLLAETINDWLGVDLVLG